MSTGPLRHWLERIEGLSPREIVLGLERAARVYERLSLPRPNLAIVVAGTNGKGSSAAMLTALLLEDGRCVGTYTSPHIRRFNERICVDAVPAPDDEIVAAFERVEAAREDVPLTYFEFGTLAAFALFAERGVDAAVLEVGMGGRLDAVNIVDADVALITNVTLDHTEWLGPDVETIAWEKAGIMRAGRPVVFGTADPPASLRQHAADLGATLLLPGRDYRWQRRDDGTWYWQGRKRALASLAPPSLRGEFQIGNAAAVLAAIEAAGLGRLLEPGTVDRAFGRLRLPGRLQAVECGGHWLFDVAHNPAAAQAVADTLRSARYDGVTIGVIGMLDDKDVEGVAAALDPAIDRWIATTAESPRAIAAPELARRIANATRRPCLIADDAEAAIAEARLIAAPDDRMLVTGSFYVVGPVLDALRI